MTKHETKPLTRLLPDLANVVKDTVKWTDPETDRVMVIPQLGDFNFIDQESVTLDGGTHRFAFATRSPGFILTLRCNVLPTPFHWRGWNFADPSPHEPPLTPQGWRTHQSVRVGDFHVPAPPLPPGWPEPAQAKTIPAWDVSLLCIDISEGNTEVQRPFKFSMESQRILPATADPRASDQGVLEMADGTRYQVTMKRLVDGEPG